MKGKNLQPRLLYADNKIIQIQRRNQKLYRYAKAKRIEYLPTSFRASQVALVVKDLPTNAGDLRDAGSILGLEQSPGEAHGNPLQYSYLENPMDREAWRAIVHGVTKELDMS